MGTLTAYGKELRKLRIDRAEFMGVMARKIGLSSAYLSAIENGTRAIPKDLTETICTVYALSEGDAERLKKAEKEQPKDKVVINFKSLDSSDIEDKDKEQLKKVALMFAQDYSKLSTAQAVEIEKILTNAGGTEGAE